MEKKFKKQEMPWHAYSHEAVLQNLESSKEGLTDQEASQRLKKNSDQITYQLNLVKIFCGLFLDS